MAKIQSSLFTLTGKIGELQFVNNKVHGAYVRMPRGTYKKATLNPVLQGNADRAKVITTLAKPVYRALQTVSLHFHQRDLWQMLLKRLYGVEDTSMPGMMNRLAPLELNDKYPMTRLVTPPLTSLTEDNGTMQFQVQPAGVPRFPSEAAVDCYRYRLWLICLSNTPDEFTMTSVETDWYGVNEACVPVILMQPLLPHAQSYLLLVAVEGSRGGVPVGTKSRLGMCVVRSGVIEGRG